ncbi:hypothetical protein IAT38_000192 [Cryptococcus sp. DSM 104549]
MSGFLSGAAVECGPTSVLKNISGRVDRDYSLQQDRLVSTPNVAGSSKAPFRPQIAAPGAQPAPSQAASSPFDLSSLRQHLSPQSSNWAEGFVPTAGPSRASPLQHHSPRVASPAQHQPQAQASGWGQEFHQHVASSPHPHQQAARVTSPVQAGPAPWEIPAQHYRPMPMGHAMPSYPAYTLPATPAPPQYAPAPSQPQMAEARPATAPPREEHTEESQDLLSRTARGFVHDLEGSSGVLQANPKLAQSKFMSLLKGLGNGGVVVDEGKMGNGEEVGEGANFVQRDRAVDAGWAGDFTSASQPTTQTPASPSAQADQISEAARLSPYPEGPKVYPSLNAWGNTPTFAQGGVASPYGVGRPAAVSDEAMWDQQFRDQEAIIQSEDTRLGQRRKSVHFTDGDVPAPELAERELAPQGGVPNNLEEALKSRTAVPGSGWGWHEQGLTDDFDEDVFAEFNGTMRRVNQDSGPGIAQQEGWDKLQSDWEAFQRAEPGENAMRGMGTGDKVERYLFQSRNPYAAGQEALFGEVPAESPTMKSILELEAAVQTDPTSHEAWYTLGLKQQENEREDQAILALSKVVQLAPDFRPAYLALAVSYTNEGEGEAGCTMLDKWIKLGEVDSATGGEGVEGGMQWGMSGRQALVDRLIDVARKSPDQVDADVQVALGVLFNMAGGEDYMKAEDCFLAALAARPDDWLLYNRLGATLANSGRSNEAIQYYHKALMLHPNFVRALFNLGIAYMNLGQYSMAAQSSLDALRIQHADASEAYAFGEAGGGAKGVTSDALWNCLRSACLHMNKNELVGMVDRRDLTGFPMSFTDA